MHVSMRNYRLPGPLAKQQQKTIQTVAVDEQQVNAQVARIKWQAAQKQARERAHILHLEAEAMATRKMRLLEQQRVEKLKMQKTMVEKRIEAEAMAARRMRLLEQQRVEKLKVQKTMIEKRKQAEVVELKKLQEQHAQALRAEQQKLQKRLMEHQLVAEQKQLAKATQAAQQQGFIDRYKASILQVIGQKWRVPRGTNKNLSSIYSIQLAPGGNVLSVKLLHSSGNSALDRSARIAILKASPLPVPKDLALFDNFRELRLTVSPKIIVRREQ